MGEVTETSCDRSISVVFSFSLQFSHTFSADQNGVLVSCAVSFRAHSIGFSVSFSFSPDHFSYRLVRTLLVFEFAF